VDDGAERLVVGLLLEDDEGADDVQTGLDHGRELTREDLERFRLDLLSIVCDRIQKRALCHMLSVLHIVFLADATLRRL